VQNVTDQVRNPFGMEFPCEDSVPGYGDANADFHVIGDHPGLHGGEETGIPFTDRDWSAAFFEALSEATLVGDVDLASGAIETNRTFFSYLHACVPERSGPETADYARLEPYFDAELRAITADVLLPVGERATRHVLADYTARDPALAGDVDDLHANELHGSGWLIVPIREPAEWGPEDGRHLVEGLTELQRTDYHRMADLGRFVAGPESYYVR